MTKTKDFVKTLSGRPILVFGLGQSGTSTVKALKDAGAKIVVGDDNAENMDATKALNVEIFDETKNDLSDYAFLLLSPGIPFTHPKPHEIVQKAKEADLEIICDVELFHRIYPDRKTIAITGTNGKSTTSMLLHHILNTCGTKSQIGGNIGTAIFDLDPNDKESWIVIEISSFQIDLCPSFRPDIAAILNITPDHLDRHGSMEHYMEVKERIAEPNTKSDYNMGIICTDDSYTAEIYGRANSAGHRDVLEISTLKTLSSGVYVNESILYDGPENIGDLLAIPTLKGIHNHQNAACAYAIAQKIGLEKDQIWAAMETFRGLNHRQYLVRTINGVSYVNDSKATNPASAAVALGAWNNIYWIVGGRPKAGLDGLEEFLPRIKHAFLIGESTEEFADWFDQYGQDYTRSHTLDKAVSAAHKMAQDNRGQPGGAGVVLLSPACASFDQFESFEDRGNQFAALVEALEEGA